MRKSNQVVNATIQITKEDRTMSLKTITKDSTKTVKTLTGKEIERVAKITMFDFETPSDVKSAFSEDQLLAFAALGYRAFCRAHAANAMMGTASNLTEKEAAELKSAKRNFKQTLASLTEFGGFTADAATAMLLSNPTFAGVKTFVELVENGPATLEFDFVKSVPTPSLFESPEPVETESGE